MSDLALPPQKAPTSHFIVLDGMRGLAALAVVAFHICEYFLLPVKPEHAYLAVDFFFILSGFVIAHAYGSRLRGGMSVGAFLRVRLIRLYPLALLGVLLGTLVYVAASRTANGPALSGVVFAGLTNALLLPSKALLAFRPWAFPVDSPLWSLAFEFWINILYALCFRWLTRASLGLTCAVGVGLLVVTSLHFHGLNAGFGWADLWAGWVRVLFPFVAGLVLRRYLSPKWHGRVGHWSVLLLVLLLVAPVTMNAWYDVAVVVLAFPCVIMLGAHARPNRVLDPAWRWLGSISYPIYVLHYPLVVVMENLMKTLHLQRFALEGAVLTCALAIGVAWLAATFYDLPLRRWLGSRSPKSRNVPAI